MKGLWLLVAVARLAGAQQPSGATLDLPAPSGPYAVGRVALYWVDSARASGLPAGAPAYRELLTYVWYPAAPNSGNGPASYAPDFARIEKRIGPALMRDEFRDAYEVVRSGRVRSRAQSGARLAPSPGKYPVLLFSHGFGESGLTYTAMLGDLASHGYIVLAPEHARDAYAAAYPDGYVTTFAKAAWDSALARGDAAAYQLAQIPPRVDDLLFLLHRLDAESGRTRKGGALAGADLADVGVFGHSLGGMAAVSACRREPRFVACMNIDADYKGLPWVVDSTGGPPSQPFAFFATQHSLYLTARTKAPAAEELAGQHMTLAEYDARVHDLQRAQDEALASVGGGAYRVDFERPGFTHRSFLDLPLLGAGGDSAMAARHAANLELARRYVRAFFDHYLRDRHPTALDESPAESTGVRVERWDQRTTGARGHMDPETLREFATRYTAAWCSQDPASVASFFATNGSLTINDGSPSVGRAAITDAARGFMTAFPDMIVRMDDISADGDRATYRWTLTGTNTGPGGTGRAVRISGYEEWRLGADGLIAESQGHFDAADYRRQLSPEDANTK